MDKESNSYVVVFAVTVCVVCSAALALTFNGLKSQIAANKAFDKQKNVLKAVGYWDPSTEGEKSRAELEELYSETIERVVIRREDGAVVRDMSEREIAEALKAAELERDFRNREFLELFRASRDGETRYVLPTLAYGLWSWLYGFLAVNGNGTEVVGITYYQDGETPGLGHEVNNPRWQAQWPGKQLYDSAGELVSVTLKKGAVNPDDPKEAAHFVDGLSGATITSNGVTRYLKWNLEAYRPFFDGIGK